VSIIAASRTLTRLEADGGMVALQVIAFSSVYRGEYVPDEYELQAITTCIYPRLAYAVEERSLH
jgi:hypothetical protein